MLRIPATLAASYAGRDTAAAAHWEGMDTAPPPQPRLDHPKPPALAATPETVLASALAKAEAVWALDQRIEWDGMLDAVERDTGHDFGGEQDSAEIRALRRWVNEQRGE